MKEIKSVTKQLQLNSDKLCKKVKPVDVIAAVRTRIEVLAAKVEPAARGDKVIKEYKAVFDEILHNDDLPTEIY